jgi:uncharacterized protein
MDPRTYFLVSLGFSWLAHQVWSLPLQYLGLGVCVVAEAVLFVPLLFVADGMAPGTIRTAALVTLLGFGALTFGVFQSRHDFSFLAPFLSFFSLFALGSIVYASLFGVHLGLWFSAAMIVLAVASILYETSEVLLHSDDHDHVGAALGAVRVSSRANVLTNARSREVVHW